MSLRHARITTALALLLLSLATVGNAAVLWDQSAIDFGSNAPGVQNYNFIGFGGFQFFCVNDVTVPAGGWTINTITEYYSDWQGVDMNITAATGNLIIMPKTGSLPSGTPTTTAVALTWVDTSQSGQGVYVMTCAGLNVNLPAGSYWITVAPNARYDSFFGNNLQWPSAMVGSPVATWYAGSWSGLYGNYDGAFKIEGVDGGATPTHSGSWGQLKSLYR
jgi:hypothetical protein